MDCGFILSPRLETVADMVREGVAVVDVGTDHAFLPVYLVMSNKSPKATACDINLGPLKNARENVEKYGIADKIKLIECYGLDCVNSADADDVVIAGMGGELISDIILRTPWLRDGSKRIIMQPMTRANELRRFLCENGFDIICEKAVSEGARVYAVILAKYTGDAIKYDDVFLYTGKINPKENPDAERYVKNQAEVLRKAASGMSKSAAAASKSDELFDLAERIEKLISGSSK